MKSNKTHSLSESNVPEIVQKYSLSLQKDLKTNSLLDIKKLTNIAREEIKHCKYFAKVISTRIKTAGMDEKLPSLYLLDSIIKNIGGEYINEFSGGISDLFFYSFKVQIDLNIQIKYLKLLKTWTTVFGEQTIHDIEERIMKISHYGPKQFFKYGQIKEKYDRQLIFVNPNKFCKSSNDFTQPKQENNTNTRTNDGVTPSLDWLNQILKTSSFVPTQEPVDTTIQSNNSLVHSLYRGSAMVTSHLQSCRSDPSDNGSRLWFLSDLDWIQSDSKKRDRSIFEEDKSKGPNKR